MVYETFEQNARVANYIAIQANELVNVELTLPVVLEGKVGKHGLKHQFANVVPVDMDELASIEKTYFHACGDAMEFVAELFSQLTQDERISITHELVVEKCNWGAIFYSRALSYIRAATDNRFSYQELVHLTLQEYFGQVDLFKGRPDVDTLKSFIRAEIRALDDRFEFEENTSLVELIIGLMAFNPKRRSPDFISYKEYGQSNPERIMGLADRTTNMIYVRYTGDYRSFTVSAAILEFICLGLSLLEPTYENIALLAALILFFIMSASMLGIVINLKDFENYVRKHEITHLLANIHADKSGFLLHQEEPK